MPLCGLTSSASSPHEQSNNSGYSNRLSHTFSAGDLGSRTGKPLSRKVVVIGDGACGKTSLLNVFVNGEFPHVYEPTVFENHVAEMVIDGVPIELALWDTAGQEDFARLRSLSYPDTHVILLCFAIDQPVSLENVESKWVDELMEHLPGVKICLVALKCDLREDLRTREKLERTGHGPVEYDEGLNVARRIRASRYLECSAKEDRGVREAFEEAARVAIIARRKGETRGSRPDGHASGGSSGGSCVIA
ncbi:P-loop containing nucleoside triphosphate hydrolase protein [Leucosporidium creatinivorum]|uniref:p-loop containing nucleoside triphosphate hydrolase protein n=1 Tax=Leucosporidium creatinivorum TaxID=106004 RepID=A0A1Y2ECG4_9BASI|nr:P-loop containing nucleoside triphosphate hydrolase protein [Leucosporidium creatinivorum]